MHLRAAQFLRGHGLVGDGFDDVGAGDEHIAGVAHHEDEVGHRRRIDVAAGAGTHDHRNLRDDARGEHVALEHFAIAAERRDALLDARAAGVEQADDRGAVLERHVLNLGDLARVLFAQGAAEDGEVLGEDENGAAVDRAPAGHHAVAGDLRLLHAEIGAAVLDEHVEFLERAVIEQKVDALARGELALGVLRRNALLSAAEARAGAAAVQPGEHLFQRRAPVRVRGGVVERPRQSLPRDMTAVGVLGRI